MIAEIVIALAIFFIGLPLAMMALFALLRVWWLIPLGAVVVVLAFAEREPAAPPPPVSSYENPIRLPDDAVMAERILRVTPDGEYIRWPDGTITVRRNGKQLRFVEETQP
jgi:hypothetical protein